VDLLAGPSIGSLATELLHHLSLALLFLKPLPQDDHRDGAKCNRKERYQRRDPNAAGKPYHRDVPPRTESVATGLLNKREERSMP
jgi:hypothetical protein